MDSIMGADLIQYIPDALFIADKDGCFREVNEAACRQLGYERDELLAMTVFDIISPENTTKAGEWLHKMDAEKGFFESVHVAKDGTHIPVEISVQRIMIGDEPHMLGSARDISPRKSMERELRQSREMYRELVENINDLIYTLNLEGCITYVSPVVRNVLGYEPSEILGKHYINLVDPRDHQRIRAAWDNIIAGNLRPREYRMITRSGDAIWVRTSSRPVLAGDRVIGVQGVLTDVTDRKNAEETLRDSELRLSHAEQVANLGSWEMDIATGKAVWSDQFYRICGFEPGAIEPSSKVGFTLIHPDDRERAAQAVTRAINEGGIYSIEKRIVRPDGTEVWVESRGLVECNATGEPVRLVGSFLDITERKKAEEELKESEEKFRSILEHMADMVFLLDDNGMVTYVSPSSEKLFGYMPEEMQGRHFRDFVFTEDLEQSYAAFQHTLDSDTAIRLVLRMKRQDGTVIYGELSGVRSRYGNKSATVGIVRDITERKALEHQLIQAQKMETVGRLAGGIAHDFNNILTVINTNAEISLMFMPENDPYYEAFAEIKKAGERAAALTHQILAFSRKQIIEPKVVNLNAILLEMDKMLRRLIGEDIELVTIPGDELMPVFFDPGQIAQILTNLVVNSRDAMPHGGKLTIATRNVAVDDNFCRVHPGINPGKYVLLMVADTGRGMDEETLSHVFEPFFTTKSLGNGTGLGLATCHGIVKQNNGGIFISSAPGQGTTVEVYLPAQQRANENISASKSRTELYGGSERILLVEDDPDIRKITGNFLSKAGYRVLTAANGEEGFGIARNSGEGIDLLITDMVMPLMSGRELAERVKAMNKDTKILFMSGYTNDLIQHHGVLEPHINFMQKPFSIKEFAKKVRDILDG